MLLRVDPEKEVLSLFSLPRDLKVDIPGVGSAKLNEAFTAGGAPQTLETVKDLTGLHRSTTSSTSTSRASPTPSMRSSVSTSTSTATTSTTTHRRFSEAEQYAVIDVNAGYQRLCGLDALDYVRYRHTDTDIVRGGAPAGLPPRGAGRRSGRRGAPDLRRRHRQRPDRHLHEVHELRSRRGHAGEVINILKSFVAVRRRPGQGGPLRRQPRADGRYVTAIGGADREGGRASSSARRTREGPAAATNATEDPNPEATRRRRRRSPIRPRTRT